MEDLNRQYPASRVCLFTQRHFRQNLKTSFPIGLCAGLVQVWWAELRKGNDAMSSLRAPTPSLMRDVLLSQAFSVYVTRLPESDTGLSAAQAQLLKLKYGQASLPEIEALQRLFNVRSALELDLVLQHELPILERWEFEHFSRELVSELAQNTQPGLYLLVARYRSTEHNGRESGHRCALAVENGKTYRFYDPSLGEITFSAAEDFRNWFLGYLQINHWETLLQARTPSAPPIRIFHFGGALSPAADERGVVLRKRLRTVNIDLDAWVPT